MPLSQSNIKFISSLRQKKFRQNYHKFTVEGEKIVDELLRQEKYRIHRLYALPVWWEQRGFTVSAAGELSGSPKAIFKTDAGASPNSTASQSADLTTLSLSQGSQRFPASLVNEKELSRISQLTTPNQVLAVVELPQHTNASWPDLSTQWSLFLDGIQSPANLGAILRVADWFGFQHVFGGPGTADLYNSKSIQASMGTFLRVDYRETDLKDILAAFPELPVLAADLSGEDIFQFHTPSAGILIIGNEGKGIRPETRVTVTNYVSIPRAADRAAESLNAAVATGILCSLLRNNG